MIVNTHRLRPMREMACGRHDRQALIVYRWHLVAILWTRQESCKSVGAFNDSYRCRSRLRVVLTRPEYEKVNLNLPSYLYQYNLLFSSIHITFQFHTVHTFRFFHTYFIIIIIIEMFKVA